MNIIEIEERFHRNLSSFLEENIPAHSRFVLAISGGLDSAVLFDLFLNSKKIKKSDFCVAHLNHGIRRESEYELEILKEKVKEKNIEFFGEKKDIPSLKRDVYPGRSVEDIARQVRYDFLHSVKKEFQADYIVTAHHKDDLLETFLMRIIKGTGINGISCIKEKDGILLRPLLEFWRSELESYAKKRDIEFFDDKTNYDTKYLRNSIRMELIPFLTEKFGNSVKEIIIRDRNNFSKANDFIDYFYEKDFKTKCEIKEEYCCVSLKELDKYPEFVNTEFIIRLYQDWSGSVFGLDSKKLSSIFNRLKSHGNFSIDIDASKYFEKSYDELLFKNRKKGGRIYNSEVIKIENSEISEIELGCLNTDYDFLIAKKLQGNLIGDVCEELTAFLDLGKLDFPLYLRNAQPGDRIIPLGMKGNKKISKILKDNKLPREMRGKIMVLLNSKHDIIWCVGYGISDSYKVNDDTSHILKLEIRKRDKN